jgi:hypothetical protein
MNDNQLVKKRGGDRKGSGRKKLFPKYPTKQVQTTVPTHLIPKFKEKVRIILEELLDN